MQKIKSYIKYFFFIPALLFAQLGENEFSKTDSLKVTGASDEQITYNGLDYLPDVNTQLVYDSDFGETISRIEYNDEGYLDINESDDFRYIQQMKIRKDGIYLLKADQHMDIFLFISRNMETVYPSPPLQLPKNLKIGDEWTWEGYKVEDDDSISVITAGNVAGEETITVPAGKFKTLKIHYTIETSEGENSTIDQWIAPNIGRVKMHISMDGNGFIGTILSLLGYDEIDFSLKKIQHIELADQQ